MLDCPLGLAQFIPGFAGGGPLGSGQLCRELLTCALRLMNGENAGE
jgi:hypothetical protein